MATKMPFLRIQRGEGWYASQLSVKIYVNNEYKGEIPGPAPGTAKDFDLPGAGSHDVYFIIDGCRSALYRTPFIDNGFYQSLEIQLPEESLLSWIFRRENFGRLVPRSPGVAAGT
jgi:hypothetical protein